MLALMGEVMPKPMVKQHWLNTKEKRPARANNRRSRQGMCSDLVNNVVIQNSAAAPITRRSTHNAQRHQIDAIDAMQYGILAQGRHQSPEDAGQQYTDVGQQRAVVFHPMSFKFFYVILKCARLLSYTTLSYVAVKITNSQGYECWVLKSIKKKSPES